MKLRFYAKCGAGVHPPPLVNWPGLKATGQLIRYVGRKLDKETRAYKAESEPVEVDSASEHGAILAAICRKDYDLWPADEATAKFCGRPFVDLKRDDGGEWRPSDRTIHPATGMPKMGRNKEVFERQDDGSWKVREAAPRAKSKALTVEAD